jgi:glutaredoxin 3
MFPWKRRAPQPPAPDRDRTLLLYKYDSCPFCMRVNRVVEQLGLDVPTADILTDRNNREALVALTGRQTVPCMLIDGVPMHESADIVAWLRKYAARPSGATT